MTMTDKAELLRLADALAQRDVSSSAMDDAVTILRKLAEQEPVAYRRKRGDTDEWLYAEEIDCGEGVAWDELYAPKGVLI